MITGATVQARIQGTVISLVLDDRVLPDRTCGQSDSGWWAYTVATEREYFISDDGTVYTTDGNINGGYTVPCGEVTDWGEPPNPVHPGNRP